MSLRAAIPLMAVTEAINKGLKFAHPSLLTFKATVHEDNMGALRLAQLEPGRNTPPVSYTHLRAHETKPNLVLDTLLKFLDVLLFGVPSYSPV